MIKIGSKVLWRGGFGNHSPEWVTITGIERCEHKRSKYGCSVEKIEWGKREYAVFDLDNGHWCYGEQLIDFK
jgi:hypothetical protein